MTINGLLVFCINNNHAYMPDQFFWSYQRMFKPSGSFAVKGNASIKMSSINEGIYKAKTMGAEWVFLMDVDQTFPRDTIPRLFRSCTKHNAKIASVLYHIGNAPYSPVAGWFKKLPNGDLDSVNSNGNYWKSEYAPIGKGVVEVDWVGAGGLLIHRDVLDAVGWPPFYDEFKENRGIRSYGHDMVFCRNAKAKGYKTIVDTDVCSDHGKMIYITKEFADGFNSAKMDEHMCDSIKDQAFEPGYWDVVWEGERIRKAERNNYPTFNVIGEYIEKDKDVLDVGCGNGALMRFLRDTKNSKCTGYDFSEVAIENCKAEGFDGKVIDLRNFEPNGERFDNIVCTSVVEHVINDGTLVGNMKKMVKDGGKLIIATPCDPMVQGDPEHIRAYTAEMIEGLMKAYFEKYEIKKNERDYIAVGYK